MADLALDPVVGLILRGGLALLFLAAAMHKWRNAAGFRAAVAAYGIAPTAWVPALATACAATELVIGASLATPGFGAAPGLAAATLLTVYSGAIAVALGRGRRDIDCGCSGPAARVPLRPVLLVRNACLIVAALAAALPPSARPLEWVDGLTVIAAVAFAALLYRACEIAIANGAWERAANAPAAAWRPPSSGTVDFLVRDLPAARGGGVVAGLVPAHEAATRAAATENRQSLSKGVINRDDARAAGVA